MLVHRLQRWSHIKPTLDQRLLLAGLVIEECERTRCPVCHNDGYFTGHAGSDPCSY